MARSSFALNNTMKPVNGPVAVTQVFSFAAGGQASQSGDLTGEMNANAIDFIQGVWIDNGDNANPLTFVVGGTGQRITVKKNHQGYYPLLAVQGPFTFVIATTLAGTLLVPVIFYNVQINPANWDTV